MCSDRKTCSDAYYFVLFISSFDHIWNNHTHQPNKQHSFFPLSILTSPSQSHACIHNTAQMFMCQFCWDVFSLQTQPIIHVALFYFHLCRHVNDKSAQFWRSQFQSCSTVQHGVHANIWINSCLFFQKKKLSIFAENSFSTAFIPAFCFVLSKYIR